VLSGGLRTPALAREAFARTGAAAVALARGSLGNPWLFGQLLGARAEDPSRDEILAEIDWVIDAAGAHLGAERAARYLRKFYPWYVARLGLDSAAAKRLNESLQRTATVDEARGLLGLERVALCAAA
jgi:tRNA-dihydrouridine synthase B